MPRPHKKRTIRHVPGVVYFKPQGVPLRDLDEVVLGLDELEALRLADLVGLSHEEVGQTMHVSRATVGRILERARRKVAQALVAGRALRIEGGPARMHTSARPRDRGPDHRQKGGHGRGRGRRNRNNGPPWAE